jgi:hypothetical protein
MLLHFISIEEGDLLPKVLKSMAVFVCCSTNNYKMMKGSGGDLHSRAAGAPSRTDAQIP